MKKVLFLRSNPVNPDSRVEKEVECLFSEGYTVDIFCWDRGQNYPLRKDKIIIGEYECTIYRVGIKSVYGSGFRKNLFPLLKFQFKIFKFIKSNGYKYDIVHACDFDTACTAFMFAKNKAFIYDIFDFYIDSFNVPGLLRWIIESMDYYVINNANAVIICSEKRRQQIKKNKQDKIFVIHNTPNKSMLNFNNTFKKNSEKIRVCYVGILNDGRMIRELLDFMVVHKNFELHIGGFGKLENLIKSYSDNNDNIIFYGRLEYKETIKLEQSCDLMTAIYDPNIPNHIFAAPNKFYEALLLGKPLIMVKGTGFSEVVEEYNIGEVIDYNFESLESALIKIANYRDRWDTIKKIENDLYLEKYDWEVMRKRLIKVYSDL